MVKLGEHSLQSQLDAKFIFDFDRKSIYEKRTEKDLIGMKPLPHLNSR